MNEKYGNPLKERKISTSTKIHFTLSIDFMHFTYKTIGYIKVDWIHKLQCSRMFFKQILWNREDTVPDTHNIETLRYSSLLTKEN